MASISHSGPISSARWLLTALLRAFQPVTDAAGAATVATSQHQAKRHYPPQRDSIFEQSAMAREMFRL